MALSASFLDSVLCEHYYLYFLFITTCFVWWSAWISAGVSISYLGCWLAVWYRFVWDFFFFFTRGTGRDAGGGGVGVYSFIMSYVSYILYGEHIKEKKN